MMFSCDSDNDNESTNANAVKSLNINPYEDPLGYKKENISSTGKKGNIPGGERHHDRISINPVGTLREVFNDSNKYQYEWAEKLGIRPIGSLAAPSCHIVRSISCGRTDPLISVSCA